VEEWKSGQGSAMEFAFEFGSDGFELRILSGLRSPFSLPRSCSQPCRVRALPGHACSGQTQMRGPATLPHAVQPPIQPPAIEPPAIELLMTHDSCLMTHDS
jgi:hypothetical protein